MTGHTRGKRSLGVLQVLIGVGAMFGGFGLMMDPSGVSLGMSVAYLQGTPFQTFFIPGIVLFLMNGLGTLAALYFTFKNHRYASYLAMVFGAGLVLWIVIQVALIGYQSLLQPLYFILGILEIALGLSFKSQQAQNTNTTVMV
ncbi:MAG: hypothetical protein GF372_14435 [Candidatus Marinimicrobia bacterium]|nr:hypothetical protein [Candidatus Neomarinimicrobiota bacterium]